MIAVLLVAPLEGEPGAKEPVATQAKGCKTKACRERVKDRRWCRRHVWECRRNQLSPGTRAMLARLRGCETRGIPFPRNYRYAGHHHGAYQYTASTWQRAQSWYAAATGRSVPRRTSVAYAASPAHQDVVTAAFFPAHRGEWACSA